MLRCSLAGGGCITVLIEVAKAPRNSHFGVYLVDSTSSLEVADGDEAHRYWLDGRGTRVRGFCLGGKTSSHWKGRGKTYGRDDSDVLQGRATYCSGALPELPQARANWAVFPARL